MVNLYGAVTDTEFNACTRTNMGVVVRSPARFSYAKPSVISGQHVDLIPNNSGVANFTITADVNQLAILSANGIPYLDW